MQSFLRFSRALVVLGVLGGVTPELLAAGAGKPGAPPPPGLPPLPKQSGADLLAQKFAFLPKVVARYGGKELTAADFLKRGAPQLLMLVGRNPNLPEAQLKKAAYGLTSQLIDRELLLQICEKAGIQPDLKKAEERLAKLEKRFGGPRGLDRILAFQGLTRAEVARQIAEEVALSEWVDKKVKPHIKVDDAAMKAYYEENKSQFETPEKMQASHILIKVKPDASPAEKAKARKKAEAILAKLKKGADFAELARKDSDGPSSRNGGDLGSFQRGQMVPAFDKAAFALKEGQLSGIVETRFGYHIIKGGKHTTARLKTFKESDAKIREQLQKKELIARVERVLKAARTAAKVEILVPEK